jgi:hypothetical protein
MVNLVNPTWSTRLIWSNQFGQPDPFGQSHFVNLTNLVNQLDLFGDETLPIWSTI